MSAASVRPGVDVGGHRRTGPHDLGRLEAWGPVEVAERVDPRYRAQVDQLELFLGQHDVFRLQVVVDQADGMQVAQRRQDLQQVGDGLRDGQFLTLAAFERLPADVFHHDVADRIPVPVGVLDKVEDLHDRRVHHLGQELAFGHRHCLRFGITGMHQALEHHRTAVDIAVESEVDPAQSAVRDAAFDLVLAGDDVPGI